MTSTDVDGSFALHVPAGIFDITVSKAGFQLAQQSGIIVAQNSTADETVTLQDATVSSIREIGRTQSASGSTAINNSESAVAVLPESATLDQAVPSTVRLAAELPGVTEIGTTGPGPNRYIAVRGGTLQTQIQIDGHPVSTGTTGTWYSNFYNPWSFSHVDVYEGPGLNQSNGGTSVYGTVNFQTPDFPTSSELAYLANLGIDGSGNEYSSFWFSGSVLPQGRLSFVLAKNAYGAFKNLQEFQAGSTSGTSALVSYLGNMSQNMNLNSEVAKIRYRFSDATSLSLGFFGDQALEDPVGNSYSSVIGTYNLAPCFNAGKPATSAATCGLQSTYSAPAALGNTGTTQTLYSFLPQGYNSYNNPNFTAEFRTTIGNDTLLVRPYAAVLNRTLNWLNEENTPGNGGPWYLATSPSQCAPITSFSAPNAGVGTGAKGPCFQQGGAAPSTTAANNCSAQTPCYIPTIVKNGAGQSVYGPVFGQSANDQFAGVTIRYLHPVAENIYAINFDYNSQYTTGLTGDISDFPTGQTLAANDLLVPPTTQTKYELSGTGIFQLTRTLQLGVTGYFTQWNLFGGQEDPGVVAAVAAAHPGYAGNINAVTPLAITPFLTQYSHFDPHVGLTWQPRSGLSFRLAGGSGITLPIPYFMSGTPVYTAPAAFNGNIGTYTVKNPNILPAVSIAYNAGVDFRSVGGIVQSLDLYDYTTHDAFSTSTSLYTGPIQGPPGSAIYQVTPVNVPIERMFGLEYTLKHLPTTGFGYYLTASMQRDYFDDLPPSFYVNQQSPLINFKQLDVGSPIGFGETIPYAMAYADVRYTTRSGLMLLVGADYTGSNNWTYGPAYTLMNLAIHIPVARNAYFQFAVDNLTNLVRGTTISAGVAGAGFGQVVYGAPTPGAAQSFSTRSTVLGSLPPQTFTFQFTAKTGSF